MVVLSTSFSRPWQQAVVDAVFHLGSFRRAGHIVAAVPGKSTGKLNENQCAGPGAG